MTAIALAHEIGSRDMIHETKAEADFEATHVAGSTVHAFRADLDLETELHDGTMNIYVPTLFTRYVMYRMWKLPTHIGRPQMHAFFGINQKKPYESKLPSSSSRSDGSTSYE